MQIPPVISIIIPSYQQGFIIGDALNSIARQTFKDYEVLVMDAMSKDSTREVVAGFKNYKVSLFSEKDTGIYDAMNKGITRSRGEFLYFMGCDDKLATDTVLENIFAKKNYLDADLIYGDVIFTKDGSKYDGEFGPLKLIVKNICHQGIFTRREVFDALGMFNVNYKYLADWDFNMRCFATSRVRKKYIPITVAYYNNNGSSFNNVDVAFMNDREKNTKKYFPKIIRYLNNHQGLIYKFLINRYKKSSQ